MSAIIVVLLFLLTGTLSFVAALFNWDWFFNSPNVAFFVKYFKRKGARLFYALLGIAIWVMAIYVFLNIENYR